VAITDKGPLILTAQPGSNGHGRVRPV